MTSTEEEARGALAAMQITEQDIARISLCPPWRHAAFAATEAVLVATPAFAMPTRMVLLVLVFAGIALIVQSDRRRLGMFINGYRRGRTRLVTIPMLVVILALYVASLLLAENYHLRWASLVLAAITFAVGYVGSMMWQRVFVRELGAA